MAVVNISEIEEWRPVEGWPYEVSSMGRVRRSRPGRGKMLGSIIGSKAKGRDYSRVTLLDDGREKTFYVHAIVCTAFHGHRPPGHEVRHLNGRKSDNHAANLCWGTRKQNCEDTIIHGRSLRGESNPHAIVTADTVKKMRLVYCLLKGQKPDVSQGTINIIAYNFGVRYTHAKSILHGYSWLHIDQPSEPDGVVVADDGIGI